MNSKDKNNQSDNFNIDSVDKTSSSLKSVSFELKFLKKRLFFFFLCMLLLIGFISIFRYVNIKSVQLVELMDLYGDINPYGSMSYGDKYVSDIIFDPLLSIDSNYEINKELINNYEINGNEISFTIKNEKIEGLSSVNLTPEYIIEYYERMMRASEASLLSNPGIQNISDIVLDGNKIKITFKSESPYNILALSENIGYLSDGYWYGTGASVSYNLEDEVYGYSVDVSNSDGSFKFITASSEAGLDENVSYRVTNMVLGKVLSDDTVVLTPKENNSYGFLTWGPNGVKRFDLETRELLFDTLENMGIRDNLSYPIDSIYSGTDLYQSISKNSNATIENLLKAGITVNESLKVGVIDLGSFREINDTLNSVFVKLNIPISIENVSITDIVSDTDFDIIYVRLERGLSPDITGLLNVSSILGRLGYDVYYENEVSAVKNSKTWEEMCDYLKDLESKMRDDGVWLFLDRGYDLVTTHK